MKYPGIFWMVTVWVLQMALMACGTKTPVMKKVMYINSYHPGYASSDSVQKGIVQVLDTANVFLEIHYLDTKRNADSSQIEKKVQEVRSKIMDFKPDLLIVSDDPAVNYLIEPYYNSGELPVVFCGVNWSSESYHLGTNTTGMLEVLPLKQTLTTVKQHYKNLKKLTVLTENSFSELGNRKYLDTLFYSLGLVVEYNFVNTYEQWEAAFQLANETADIIYLPTNGAIEDWSAVEARNRVEEVLQIPIITCDDFMMDYAVFGLTKVASEQGEWAALKALEILNGKLPQAIPVARNTKYRCWVNPRNAGKIGFVVPKELTDDCSTVH